MATLNFFGGLSIQIVAIIIISLAPTTIRCLDLTRTQTLSTLTGSSGQQNLDLSWGTNATHIEVQLAYPTLGWLAFGLSPTGGMDQADVLFGYVNDSTKEVVIQDRYLTANMAMMAVNLTLDTQQDWQAVSGSKNKTYTTIRAVRRLRTCDSSDRPFTNSLTSIIYAGNFVAPLSPTATIKKHNFRGTTSVNFLQDDNLDDPDISSEVSMSLEFRMDNRTITGDADTRYNCKLTTLPNFEKKYQSIASQPIINKQNMKQIHHMLLYVCKPLPAQYSSRDFFDCGPTSNSFIMQYCQNLIGGWAMGAPETEYEPADVGLPFTPEMSGLQVVLQIHYNNPERKIFTDDSGMRFLLTDKVRKYDSGTLMAGVLSLDFTMTIPPGLDTFHIQGQCSDKCTSRLLPPDGINIYSAAVHMHNRGLSGVARHFRGDQEILPPLASELHWDFNFQQSKPVEPFRKFLPGDRIVMECNYTSINDSNPVYGGEGSMEEMCLVFLDYYPKADLSTCGAMFNLPSYLDTIGLTPAKILQYGILNVSPAMLHSYNESVRHAVKGFLKGPVTSLITSQKWTPDLAAPFEDFYTEMNYLGICIGKGNVSVVLDDEPPESGWYIDQSQNTC
ncbi:DBH-like monooxygenase protein 1-like protein [Hypsibius exemplaris]|uniref:DBH-like monooxygenase protein 1-like protein n=1 Tax=Hypsibius exemplaris TaxID=2072580 RepID=A0A1W0X5P2_HYPEX|nr:DBH-like monooxygenase protein 1-like protein [Hypsibius exemplaris]